MKALTHLSGSFVWLHMTPRLRLFIYFLFLLCRHRIAVQGKRGVHSHQLLWTSTLILTNFSFTATDVNALHVFLTQRFKSDTAKKKKKPFFLYLSQCVSNKISVASVPCIVVVLHFVLVFWRWYVRNEPTIPTHLCVAILSMLLFSRQKLKQNLVYRSWRTASPTINHCNRREFFDTIEKCTLYKKASTGCDVASPHCIL